MAKHTDQLRECLAGLETILSRAGIFGGNEVAKAGELRTRIKRLLSPEPAEPLVAEAATFVKTYLPYIEARKQQARAQEAGQEYAEAQRKKAHDAHKAKQLAAIEQERQRVEQMIARNAVNEVI